MPRPEELLDVDEAVQALTLTIAQAPLDAVTGGLVAVELELRNNSASDVEVMAQAHPDVWIVDVAGERVNESGWTTATGLSASLAAGEAIGVQGSVELRGRRGEARNVPLRPGVYLLMCRLAVSRPMTSTRPRSATRTLWSPSQDLRVAPTDELVRDRALRH